MTAAFAAPASAATCEITSSSRGGAVALASLISAAVAAADVADVQVCDVHVLNNSLNNLLRNADIDVLNNVLNNSANNILRDANIEVLNITDNVIQVNILSGGIVVDTVEITLVPA